jgi:hypothetical protein
LGGECPPIAVPHAKIDPDQYEHAEGRENESGL